MGACFEHQFAGFGDEHKEADDVGVRHREWASLCQLFAEEGNHRAVGAEHVAKAGGDKLRHALHLSFLDSLVQALHVDFADTLGAAHDVGGIHRFVGGNHHELLHLVFHTEVGDDLRAPHVVLHAFAGVVLHHGHVLVGCGVEDVVGAERAEDFLHAVLLADGGDHGMCLNVGVLLGHHQADVVLRCFGLVDEYHFCGMIDGDLAYHLRTDGACRTCNHHLLAAEECADAVHIHLYLVARQQVLNLDFAQLHLFISALVLVPLFGILGDEYLHAQFDEHILEFLVVHEEILLEGADEQGLNVLLDDDGAQVLLCGVDALAHDALLVVGLFVADISLDEEADGLGVERVVGHGDGTGVGAIDKGVFGGAANDGTVESCLDEHTRGAQQGCGGQISHNGHAAGEFIEVVAPIKEIDTLVKYQGHD